MYDPEQHQPTKASKDKEREQIQADVEAFLLAGGEIEIVPPMKVTKYNTVNVKKSTEWDRQSLPPVRFGLLPVSLSMIMLAAVSIRVNRIPYPIPKHWFMLSVWFYSLA